MNKYFFVVILLVLFSGCKIGNEKNSGLEVETIYVDSETNVTFDLDKIAEFSHSVALETKDDCLIGEIKKVFLVDSSIVVWDSKLKRIYVFDQEGYFSHTIGSLGNKRDEYISIADVQVDGNTVILLDNVTKRVMNFSINGEFLSARQITNYAYSLCQNKEGTWILKSPLDENDYLLAHINNTSNVMDVGYFSYNDDLPISNYTNFFDNQYTNEQFFNTIYRDTIYQLKGNQATPFLAVDFKNKRIRLDNSERLNEYIQTPDKYHYVGCIQNCFFYKDKLFFSFLEKKQGEGDRVHSYNAYVSLNDDSVTIYKLDVKAHSDVGIQFVPRILGLSQGQLIYEMNPSYLPEELLEKNLSPKYSGLVSSESNPILLFYTLK